GMLGVGLAAGPDFVQQERARRLNGPVKIVLEAALFSACRAHHRAQFRLQQRLREAELRAMVSPTRREEGCLKYNLYRSVEAPSALLLHEVWASREAHTEHT